MGDRRCPVCHETVSRFDQDLGLIFFKEDRRSVKLRFVVL